MPGKILFLSDKPKSFRPIRMQDSFNYDISQTFMYEVEFSYMIRYSKKRSNKSALTFQVGVNRHAQSHADMESSSSQK